MALSFTLHLLLISMYFLFLTNWYVRTDYIGISPTVTVKIELPYRA